MTTNKLMREIAKCKAQLETFNAARGDLVSPLTAYDKGYYHGRLSALSEELNDRRKGARNHESTGA